MRLLSLIFALVFVAVGTNATEIKRDTLFEESVLVDKDHTPRQRCTRNIFKTLFKTKYKRNCGCKRCDAPKKVEKPVEKTYVPKIKNVSEVLQAYDDIHHECKNFAPLSFEYVDFRLKNDGIFDSFKAKLGNYRFRIFGCRRDEKSAYLNVGRIMQKDMKFFDIFNKMYGECFNQIKMPADLCDPNATTPIPHYILTAEITDYFMNICDEFDWSKTKKLEKRNGSSEMTIVWRLLDLTKNNVYWKGESTGYGQVEYGETNGEMLLVERAFTDALYQLRGLPGFEAQLATFQNPEEMLLQRQELAEIEKNINPFKCNYAQELVAIEQDIALSDGQCPACACQCDTCATCEEKNWEEFAVEEPAPVEDAFEVAEAAPLIVEEVVAAPAEEVLETPMEEKNVPAVIDEKAGMTVSAAKIADEFDVNPYVSEDMWIEIPLDDPDNKKAQDNRKIVEEEFSKTGGRFCIENQLTFKKMNPHNLYKVRASIVNISNKSGITGAGLIISDQFILTSANLVNKEDNNFDIKTINGKEFKASAFRVSPSKNVALLLLEDKTEFTPLPLNLQLPQINADDFMVLGMFVLGEEGEGWIDDSVKVTGYRYSEQTGTEMVTDSFTQEKTVGGALVDMKGNIFGLAHAAKRLDGEPDMFVPIESALKSLDVELCGRDFLNEEVPQENVVMKAVENPVQQQEQKIDETEIK